MNSSFQFVDIHNSKKSIHDFSLINSSENYADYVTNLFLINYPNWNLDINDSSFKQFFQDHDVQYSQHVIDSYVLENKKYNLPNQSFDFDKIAINSNTNIETKTSSKSNLFFSVIKNIFFILTFIIGFAFNTIVFIISNFVNIFIGLLFLSIFIVIYYSVNPSKHETNVQQNVIEKQVDSTHVPLKKHTHKTKH